MAVDRRTLLKGAVGLGAAAGVAAAARYAFDSGPSAATSRVVAARPASRAQPPAPRLSTRQLAGQRVIFSYPGQTVPENLLAAIRAGQVGGVIFFEENIASDAQAASAITQLRQAEHDSPVSWPLLLMTDQEGGLVRRLPGAPVASEAQIGSSSDPAGHAAQAGQAAAANLSGVGMNMNLAPVLDVYDEPGNFIDRYQRSYSSRPTVVAQCGAAFVTAQQRADVVAVGKHFPGLGSATASQDTDTGPVTLSVSAEQLRARDEYPYHAAIRAGLGVVMVSWAVYPNLDPDRPAGLSSTVVHGELRGRVGFGGVTITDAIEAGALQRFGSYGQRAVSAAGAGMDLVLCSATDVGEGEEAVAALVRALETGTLARGAFERAIERVRALRQRATPVWWP